jgi:hypothetical protein
VLEREENTANLPTVLIVTEVPWIYQALREGLPLVKETRGRANVDYDEGTISHPFPRWHAKMPVGDLAPDVAPMLFDDTAPSLVIVVQERSLPLDASIHLIVPKAVRIGSATERENGRRIELLAEGVRMAARMRMRGDWLPGDSKRVTLSIADEWSVDKGLSAATIEHARARGCGVVVLAAEVSPQILASGLLNLSSVPAFIRGFLERLNPADILSRGASPAPPAVPPPISAPVANPIPLEGSIARFEMRGLRMFEHLIWQAPAALAGWHVILGDNASGKSSLLRALALCLLDRDERDSLRQSWDTWLRKSASGGAVRVDLTTAEPTSHSIDLTLRLVAAPKGMASSPTVDVQSSERLHYAGFLAAYGPFRRFTGGDAEWVKSFKSHPRLQGVLTLFDERAALSDALEWLKDLWVRARTVTPTPPEAAFLKDLLAFINETDFLPPGVEILEPDADGVWCRDGNGLRVPAIDLSDGYRAVLSLALDLLRRFAAENGFEKVFEADEPRRVALEGIVLIDEVDAHLHPTWQQRIGFWFKERFPRVQFLIATHSAIVCQAADSVMLLPEPGRDEEPRMATEAELDRLRYGDLLDAFSTDFFGERVTRSQAGREKLSRLAELNDEMLSRKLTRKEQKEREQLRRELGTVGNVVPGEGDG